MKLKALPMLVLLLSGVFGVLTAQAQTKTYTTNIVHDFNCNSISNCVIHNVDGSTSWITAGQDIFYGSCVGSLYTTSTFGPGTFSVTCNHGTFITTTSGTYHLGWCRYGVCQHLIDSGTSSITATLEELHAYGVPGY